MYFPYLRAKKYELKALNEMQHLLRTNQKIVPIIEPVRNDTKYLRKALNFFNATSIPYVLITNPLVGDLKSNNAPLQAMIESQGQINKNAHLGYIVNQNTTLSDADRFLEKYSNYNIAFIHFYSFAEPLKLEKLMARANVRFQIFIENEVSEMYRDVFSDYQRVLIRDGFKRAPRNADYPQDEFFTTLHLTFRSQGNDAFGDFATVGRDFIDRCGAKAHAVALHLTYCDDPRAEIKIRHFLSDRQDDTGDIAGKFLEALSKLMNFLRYGYKLKISQGCLDFQRLYQIKHFSDLGEAKKISIKHHIELMSSII